MLGIHKIMAFAPTLDANNARPFYEGVLGLWRITSTLAWFDRCLRNAKNKAEKKRPVLTQRRGDRRRAQRRRRRSRNQECRCHGANSIGGGMSSRVTTNDDNEFKWTNGFARTRRKAAGLRGLRPALQGSAAVSQGA